jgi:uncharacterized protein YprB with RNaseH-like and TPR domain
MPKDLFVRARLWKSVSVRVFLNQKSSLVNRQLIRRPRLWWDYVNNNDTAALQTLLAYNREDVVNLKILREKLSVE